MSSNPNLNESELILNPDGSIYHLNLKPGDLAETIITVGDPDRVEDVSAHFNSIEFSIHKREFKTVTGSLNGRRLTVISTGIGTDNIDIVFNEIDALFNINFPTRELKEIHTPLNFVRIGTSGAIQPDIPVDSFLISETAVGFDNLLHFYHNTGFLDEEMAEAIVKQTQWNPRKSAPYVVNADKDLMEVFSEKGFIQGMTATNVGFYGPQGRKLRLMLEDDDLNNKLQRFQYGDKRITNLEMETSGIYGMAKLLGHKAVSLNAILANRVTGDFSNNPSETVQKLIKKTLDLLTA